MKVHGCLALDNSGKSVPSLVALHVLIYDQSEVVYLIFQLKGMLMKMIILLLDLKLVVYVCPKSRAAMQLHM